LLQWIGTTNDIFHVLAGSLAFPLCSLAIQADRPSFIAFGCQIDSTAFVTIQSYLHLTFRRRHVTLNRLSLQELPESWYEETINAYHAVVDVSQVNQSAAGPKIDSQCSDACLGITL
jgi:hypothetical protein